MERLEQLVINAPAPLFLTRISLPSRLSVELKKVAIHKHHIKQEGPSKSLPSPPGTLGDYSRGILSQGRHDLHGLMKQLR